MPTPLEGQIILKIGGTISCIGSGFIMQDVLRHPDKRSKSIYHRIMVGLSAMDIFFSFSAHILGSWPMPKGSWLWAVGNMASCDTAAFISMIGFIGSPLYNCSLATYYSLQLKYNWQDHRMKRIEKWFHIVPCLIPTLYSIIALCTKTIGPNIHIGGCVITLFDYPEGCSDEPDSEVKCIRRVERIDEIMALIGLLIPFICLIYVSITMYRVYKAVRDIEINVIEHSFVARHREQDKRKTMKRSRRVMIQGILYGVAMILTWTWTFTNFFIFFISKEVNPVIDWFAFVSSPLQGIFNFLIYLIPVFRKMLKTHRLQKKDIEEQALHKDENKEKSTTVNSMSSSSYDVLLRPEDNREKSVRFQEKKEKGKQDIESLPPVFSMDKSENGQDGASSSGKTLFPYENNRKKSIRFEEEKEEEKREIESLPPVFSLERSENGQDERSCIYETQNNKNNINDDGDDYYE